MSKSTIDNFLPEQITFGIRKGSIIVRWHHSIYETLRSKYVEVVEQEALVAGIEPTMYVINRLRGQARVWLREQYSIDSVVGEVNLDYQATEQEVVDTVQNGLLQCESKLCNDKNTLSVFSVTVKFGRNATSIRALFVVHPIKRISYLSNISLKQLFDEYTTTIN